MTPALMSGGAVLAVLMDPKILRISSALNLSPRYLSKFFSIFSLLRFALSHIAWAWGSGHDLLPDDGGNSASNSSTDPCPEGQQSNHGCQILVRDGSLSAYTRTDHDECTAKGNEDLRRNK